MYKDKMIFKIRMQMFYFLVSTGSVDSLLLDKLITD